MNSEEIKNKEKINPKLTQSFVEDVLKKGKEGVYRVEVKVGDRVIPIDVYPEVFPPKSDYSVSSRSKDENLYRRQTSLDENYQLNSSRTIGR